MELDRRVQIRVDWLVEGVRKKGFGSGYLVAPRLVLTAAHILDHLDPVAEDPVTVSLPDIGEQNFSATVCWQRRDFAVDAALLEVTDGQGWEVPRSLGNLLTRPPQRYGLFIGTRPHPVSATGFPRMQKNPEDGRRFDEHVPGTIAPGTGALASRYEISSTHPTPRAAVAAGESQWAGMSGAPVLAEDGFGGDLLCGLVRRDRRAEGGSRLTATPAAGLVTDDAFRALITAHTGWEPVLEPIEPAAVLAPAAVERKLRSPAALLRADVEAVAFHGRELELADLRAWCESGPDDLSVRVITGPGGQGKTRLARRLTTTLGWKGWATGHLRSDLTDHDPTPPDFTTLATALPLLVVVDYAETRPRLLRRLITHLHRSRHRVRLLLLARSDGEWRTGSLQAVSDVRDLLEEAPVIPLAPLLPAEHSGEQPAGDRRRAYDRAARGLAHLLPLVFTMPAYDWPSLAAALPPPTDLHGHRYENVLTLQMTALVALLQNGPRPVDVAPGTPLERTLLKHEERFWDATATSPTYRLALPTATLSAAVAVADLCGAGAQDEALRVISTLSGLPTHQAGATAAWVAALYPADGNRYWGSLQPDRIAEYHASRALADGIVSLPALLNAATPGQQAQTITVLARAAIAHYNADRATASEQVLRTLNTALDTASLTYGAVDTAVTALPYPSRVTGPLALRLTTLLARADQQLAADDPATHEPDAAASLYSLGVRLAEAGRRHEALTATQQAVKIYRRLAADNPGSYEPALAASLASLGVHLGEAGRQSEALTTGQQELEIYRRLAADDPGSYEPALAASLTNLGVHLSYAGRRNEALTATQQAVEIHRRLAADNPAAHESDLATALYNLGVRLSEAGRRNEALSAIEQAVKIRRRLAAADPAAYESDLAASLTSLGVHLGEVERWAEALSVAEQAAEIYRRLTADNPAAHEPDFATAQNNLSNFLAVAGRHSEALTTAEQAVEICHRLAADNPAAYEPNLAASLGNLSTHLAEAGRRSEAVTVAEEAAEIYRRLTADNPAAYELDLTTALTNLYMQLARVGDLVKALHTTGEVVELYRRHVAAMPFVLPQLHTVLSHQAQLLGELGRREESDAIQRWLHENPLPPELS